MSRWTIALLVALLAAPARGQEPKAPPPKAAPKAPPKAAKDDPPTPPVTFEELYRAAADDIVRQPPEHRKYIRYFDARPFTRQYRKEAKAVFDYHVNALSREHKIERSREVTEWLWAVKISDYGWPPEVYEDLVRVNFYHSIPVKIVTPVATTEVKVERKPVVKKREVTKTRQVPIVVNGRQAYRDERYTVIEEYTDYEEVKTEVPVAVKQNEKNEVIPAPWVPAKEAGFLIQQLQTKVPVFRADQFVHRTAVQKDRNGHGYYDFFGFKKLSDVEKFVKLDRKGAIEVYRELGAIVAKSGVTLNNRQLFRLQTITGPWWESRDVSTNTGKQEATGNLLEQFDAEAFEIVFRLYNGLPGYYLANKDGVQQETAPDFIAGDQRATGNDRRIHAGMSCVVCHFDGGLRPIRDWARKIYDPEKGIALGTLALDEKRSKRAESVYLGPLFKNYKRDADDFAEAIFLASELKPDELAKAYETFWSEYLDKDVTLERAAREIGVDPKDMQDTMIAQAKKKRLTDTVLTSYLVPDPLPVRREHFEERFGLLMLILGGVNP